MSPRPTGASALLMAGVAALATACSPAAGTPGQTVGGSASPVPSVPASNPATNPVSVPASPSPDQSAGTGEGVIVTFRVADEEEYRIRLTDSEDIEIARRLLAGEEAPAIPSGVVVRDGNADVNAPWSWHIDPETVQFADMTIEVCDGRPSDVEAGTITDERFCPWSAEVIDIEE